MYLDVTQTIDETLNLIKDMIRTNTPFSLSRFGDGEIKMLNRDSPKWHQQKGCSNWGYKYPSQVNILYDDATAVILNAIRNSDVVGIMDKKNDIAKSINYSQEKWSIKKSFLDENNVDTSKLIICDHMLTRNIKFGKPENFKEILQGKSLNIISPNVESLKKKNLNKLLDADVTFTHHPMSITIRNRNEFIDNFKNIKSDVVLVGCGLQKDFVVYLKNNYGKVAIYAGATLDAWAGKITRPWFNPNGKQNYLLL